MASVHLGRISLKKWEIVHKILYEIFSFDDAKEDHWLKFQKEPKNNKDLRETLINSNIKITHFCIWNFAREI